MFYKHKYRYITQLANIVLRPPIHLLLSFYIFAFTEESTTDSELLLIQRLLWLVAGLGRHQQR